MTNIAATCTKDTPEGSWLGGGGQRSGKRFWRNPKTGEVRVEGYVQMLHHAEVRMLQETGWEFAEVEGYTKMARPNSGRLYPEAVAVSID